MNFRIPALVACVAGCTLSVPAQARINFSFDYSLDSGFFTSNPAAKTALDRAATVYSDRILDQLTDITPGGGNTWSAVFSNPSTGASMSMKDLTIAAGTIKVYVGGANLGGALGQGGPGGFSGDSNPPDPAFLSNLQFRGQTGASASPPTDFARWGGTISFDQGVNWNFNLNGPATGKNDFLTVATHELAHVLGFGTSPAFRTFMTKDAGTQQYVGPFTGPKAMALNGGPLPMETPAPGNNAQHYANSLMSTVGGVTPQEALMDPDITTGTRKKITLIDWAALDDLGWDLATPGDATADGSVDFNDLVKLAQNYNVVDGQRRWSDGDFNYDGNVDFNDLVALAQGYNSTGVQGAASLTLAAGETSASFASDWERAQAVAGVPEPSVLAMGGIVFGAALLRRSRGRRV
jgi:hypothetical protein